MKTRHILLSLVVFATSLFAMPYVPYDYTKRPSLSLPAAYTRAVDALGADTNQFYSVDANLTMDFGPPPRWRFVFSTTNTPPKFKWVLVPFDGKAHVEMPPVIMEPEMIR